MKPFFRLLRIGAVAAVVLSAAGPHARIAFANGRPSTASAVPRPRPAAFQGLESRRPEPEREPAAAFDPTLPVPTLETAGGRPVDAIRAGDQVWIRWRSIHRDVEELEVLISIDGGRAFGMRVSPDLEGGERRYAWRVPNLAAEDARIRLRVGALGREIEGPISSRFTIEPDRNRPRERWVFLDRPWWDGAGTPRTGSLAARPGGAELRAGDRLPVFHRPTRIDLPAVLTRAAPSPPRETTTFSATGFAVSVLRSRSTPIRE